jgi:hypothetical protein
MGSWVSAQCRITGRSTRTYYRPALPAYCPPGISNVSRLKMRIASLVVSLLLLLLLLLALAGKEVLWLLDHPEVHQSTQSPSGSRVAEVRHLPEGSPVPYGVGVFLYSRWVFARSLQSHLAFGGYCSDVRASFPGDQELKVRCQLTEGQPFVPRGSINGVAVEVVLHQSQPANPSIERTSPGRSGAASHVKR